MKKRRASRPTKTYRFRLGHRPKADVWFGETQALFNRVAAFYFDVIEAHPAVLELADKDALTALEHLTHTTAKNPHPVMPLAEAIPEHIPALFRRAAIHAALGSARSFHSNLERWRQQKAKAEEKAKSKGKPSKFHARPPVPPRRWNKSTVLYDGMWDEFDGHTVLLNVWTGVSWTRVKFQVSGRPVPAGWKMGSPQIVRRGGRWHLHIPTTCHKFKFPAKVEKQLADQKKMRICAVDLNINDCLAVCTIHSADGAVVATLFIRGGRELQHCRKRALGRVARNRSRTGVIREYQSDNAKLFRYVRAIDNDTAHRVSRRIVEFAREYGASVIVFEHLGHFRPEKGKYSKRGNEKRSYWLRGRIYRYTQYKAWEYRIITSRVNPRNTSRECADCHQPVARYNAGEAPLEYRPGAPLFLCPACLKRGNADRNASVNIGHRFFDRYSTHLEKPQAVSVPPKEGAERRSKEQGVAVSHGTSSERYGAQRTRKQGKPEKQARPSSEGADDRVGTAQEKREGPRPSRRIPRTLRPQRSCGYAANTPSAAYDGLPEEAAAL